MKLLRYGCVIERLGDRYRLEGMLGSGGMADVCLAWDEHEQREVAIKIIKVDGLDQRALDRFQKEAAAVLGWDHPHILHIYDDLKLELLDAARGSIVPYMVVEYAQGGDLHKRLRPNQPYPLAKALYLFAQLCSAVQYAHEHGVIHRDLKPLNILFRILPDGTEQAVLSDFGLAVQTDATHHTFAQAGTLAYMAPEQLRGHSTVASDIFALGVILYQLCTGKLPFRRSLQDLRSGHFMAMPPLPSTVNPRLPKALDEVILIALAEEQAERYANAAQFWETLQATISTMTMPDPVIASIEEDDGSTQPAHTASQNLAEPGFAIQNPSAALIEPPAMSASNFTGFVPTSDGTRYASIFKSIPTTKLDEAGHDSSIWYTGINRDSVLDVPDSVILPSIIDLRQNTFVTPQVTMIAASDDKETAKRPRPFRPRILVAFALVVLALLVVFASAFYFMPSVFGTFAQSLFHSAPANVVTIIPASQNVASQFAILAVTGTPNSSQRQVQARQLTYTTPVQSKTVNATGVVNTQAAHATGTLTLYNAAFAAYFVAAGAVVTGKDGISVVTTSGVTIPAAVFGTPAKYGVANVAAQSVNTGVNQNIVALDINNTICCGTSNTVFAKNFAAFSGGQDQQHYTFVQQSDIDAVATPLVSPAEGSALTAVKALRQMNEQFVGSPLCTPNVKPNPAVGGKAQTVTVSVSATCVGEVYDQSATIALATSSLQNQADRIPGANYKLVGKIVINITKITVVDNMGTISLVVNAAGIWEYNFGPTQKAQLAQLLEGKSQSAAQRVLAVQAGVSKVVSITLSSGTTFPTDSTQITITVQDATGLSGTPTSTGLLSHDFQISAFWCKMTSSDETLNSM